MIRLILLTDFTESFSYNLLKGVLAYSKSHEPWVVCRMPPSYKNSHGIEGVLKWAKTWHADAIIGRFDNDDNVELFRENGIIALAQDYKSRFSNIPNITGDYRKIAILGVDNDEIICNLSDPPLSSISQNIVRGGFEAAALIEHLLNDEEATYQDVVLQPVNIINRLSTDFYSTTDAHIQTALKYIHQNIAADITVSDIVKQVPLSRRLLEIRFKQVTQQSIHKYIFNLRMERFAQLLLASDAPIADVAEQVGINNLKNLSRQFKALKKVSPNEYRKEYQTKSYQR